MGEIDRRTFIVGLGAAVTLGPGIVLTGRDAQASEAANLHLTKVNPRFLVNVDQVRAWHTAKDSKGGPTLSGSPSWRNYIELLEKELKAAGVKDILRNPIKYTRWHTSEWPDDSNWSLVIGGEKMKVASYGCNSGKTPDAGVTAPLAIFEPGMPADALKGKIAIVVKPSAMHLLGDEVKTKAAMEPVNALSVGDYEYLANPETFPDPLRPMTEIGSISPFGQMGLGTTEAALKAGGALGAIIVMGLSYDALAGTYTFPVPALHDMPTLYLDRDAGAKAIAAAKAGKTATLRLNAKTEEAETYQLFGYLPGKNYGTDADEQVMLITHTDGPSISQENGGLGILSVVRYFANVPQAERPRTLMIFLDCRHYMPGAEAAFAKQDYAASHPEIYKKVIAAMGIEHLGQIKVSEADGKPYHRTELPELSAIWVTNNQQLVDMAVKAAKDNRLKRIQVQCPGRPGAHGKEQGRPYGLGMIARRLNIAGASTMGLMAAYWSSKARLDYLDANHFVTQVATMSQICGELMLADVTKIKTAAG